MDNAWEGTAVQANGESQTDGQIRARLAALNDYDILGTSAEPGFDDIVSLAVQICEAPVALVSLVTDDRQLFKARIGFDARETPLDQSVCRHGLRAPGLLIIPDLTLDPRTSSNPLVTGVPHLRFYAGARLDTPEGLGLGMLCVIDTKPRPEGLTPVQAKGLEALARQVMTQMELRRAGMLRDEALRTVRQNEARHRQILESAIDYAIVTTDLGGFVTGWSAGAERILGWPETEVSGRAANVFFTEEDEHAHLAEREMREARTKGRGSDERWHRRKDGSHFWALVETMPLTSEDGQHVGYLKILRDRTQQRHAAEALEAQSNLLRNITDHVSEAVFQLDRAGDIMFANPVGAAMLGWSREQIRGRNFHDLAHHHHADGTIFPAVDCELVQALRSGHATSKCETVFFRRDGTPLNVVSSSSPIVEGGVIQGAVLTVVDITERKRDEDRQVALVQLGDRLRGLTDQTEMAYVAAEIAGRTLGLSGAAYGTVDQASGQITIDHDWHHGDAATIAGRHSFSDFGTYFEDLLRGDTVAIPDVEADPRTRPAALHALGIRTLLNIPLIEHGRLVAVFCLFDGKPRNWSTGKLDFLRSVVDRTRAAVRQQQAEADQAILNQELSHRMKNLLAMVQAIASQTMRSATDLKAARDVLSGRLIALGQAHDLLVGGRVGDTGLAPIVRGAVRLHEDRPGRFRIAGPDLRIGAKAAMALALMVHELATNAAKYGALSTEVGHVDIEWRVSGEQNMSLRLFWAESGGPPVTPPAAKGFGSRFIERALAAQIGGTIDMAYPVTGVTCIVQGPLANFQADT